MEPLPYQISNLKIVEYQAMANITQLLNLDIVNSTHSPLVQPLYGTSLFRMPDYQTAMATEHAIHPLSYYSRWGNPTVAYLENQLSLLLNKEKTLIFPTGMAAITTTLFSLLKPNDVIAISNALYGDTSRFFLEDLIKWGVKVKIFDPTQVDTLARLCVEHHISFVYYETLSNPDLKAVDLRNIQSICQKYGMTSICDSTFTPPLMLKNNIELADIVIMSLTKYMGGHSTVFGGSVSCNQILFKKIWHTQSLYGAAIDPYAAWQLSQGVKTLAVRLDRQASSATQIAHMLSRHNQIARVIYPGSEHYEYAKLSSCYLNHGGAVIAFLLNDGDEPVIEKFLNALRVVQLSVSLGGIHSCIEHAQTMSHSMLAKIDQELLCDAKLSYPDHALIRLSIGIEEVSEIEQDLIRSLSMI